MGDSGSFESAFPVFSGTMPNMEGFSFLNTPKYDDVVQDQYIQVDVIVKQEISV